ncbi:DUF2244 domain-containing protein [Aliiglaciecola sp. LCG003]|uniref:DUF2244 domain-containing protein n=1 Tax=Aliiglaciecola sp. LCG003 TaxID=3053655 RepID=UPI00257412A0|nr:DUF2244 domain-containing protein [Aliiglaciecola sp. LCG003]WJG08229.1 DUF2244 domain-containing protein [Aliiglaciecola sp. LCG003]
MVNTQIDSSATIIELSPNRSVSWQQAKLVVTVMAVFVLLIATLWALLGAWFILPFAGFEVALLAWLMYRVNLNCHARQVLTITPSKVTFECGISHPVFRWQFNRLDTHLRVTEVETSFDRLQFVLSDEHISIRIGDFLNQQDCCLARKAFKHAGLREISNKWWMNNDFL